MDENLAELGYKLITVKEVCDLVSYGEKLGVFSNGAQCVLPGDCCVFFKHNGAKWHDIRTEEGERAFIVSLD